MAAKRSFFSLGTLRAQLLWWLVPPVLLVVAVSSFISFRTALRYANDAYDAGLLDQAKALADQIKFDPGGRLILELPRAAEEMLRYDPYDRIFYRVMSGSGATVIGRRDVPYQPLLSQVSPASQASKAARPIVFYDAQIGSLPVRVCAYTLFDNDKRAMAVVAIAETLVKRTSLARSLLLSDLVAPIVVLPVLMALILWLGIQRALTPLQDVTAAIARRGLNDLTTLGDYDAPDEVRPLTGAIDDLMRRLGLALGAQQRFIGNAAHQLRTPLAGLTAQVDRALLAQDMAGIRAGLVQLGASSRRISRLANQLLTLLRAEPGAAERDFAMIDIAAIVQQTCRDWVPQALQQQVDLGFAGETEPVMRLGSELLLVEMLNNLIDNALRYGAAAGGSVTVRLAAAPHIEITVEDDGPGLPAAEHARVFERFYRVPGSPSGGSGLGLAIVREIAGLHAASATVHSRDDAPGTLFRIVFDEPPVEPHGDVSV